MKYTQMIFSPKIICCIIIGFILLWIIYSNNFFLFSISWLRWPERKKPFVIRQQNKWRCVEPTCGVEPWKLGEAELEPNLT